MGLLGMFIGITFLVWLILAIFDGELYIGIACGLLLLLCIYGVFWDVSSPVEIIVSEEIITNDYEKYGLEIESDRLGRIRKIEKEATNFGAVFNDSTTYSFIDFVDIGAGD